MKASLLFARLRNWGIKGGLSILDQGLYSGANFAAAILLARWQRPEDYGVFSVAFATFLYSSGIYNSLILEPISILGPSRYSENQDYYLASQLWIHFLVAIPLSIGFGLFSLLLQESILRKAFQSASLALPFMLLTWLARRTYYSAHQPFGAVICSSLYAMTLFAGLWMIWRVQNITVNTIFAIMSVAGILGGCPLLLWGFRYRKKSIQAKIPLLKIVYSHWDLGKWIVFAAAFSLAAEQIPVVFLATLRGPGEAGAYRAIQNLILPVIQVEAALSLIGLPMLAREYDAGNVMNFRHTVLLLVLGMTGVAVLYEIFVWFTGDYLEQIIYGGQYAVYSRFITYYGLVPIMLGLFSGFFMSLRAIQKTQIYLINGVFSFVIGIPSAYLLTKSFGLFGAILGLIFMYMVVFVLNLYLYFRWVPTEKFD